jgi:hypothetical protein
MEDHVLEEALYSKSGVKQPCEIFWQKINERFNKFNTPNAGSVLSSGEDRAL